ncbi:MAG: glycosyltransferase, partial [Candidatus Paceibacterota bacterium]
MQYKLSVLIPSRNEEFLSRTVQDLLENTSDATEILVGLDGEWASPPIDDNDRVNIVYVPVSIGQRAMTNLLCRLSRAKYVAKIDAHCSFDKDWDLKMFAAYEETGDNVTMVSMMR